MKEQMLIVVIGLILLTSCKKTYTCACGDMNSTERTPVWEVKDTKKNAGAKCAEHLAGTGSITNFTCEIR